MKPTTVKEYINSFPQETQDILRNIRELIIKNAPDVEESLAYGMPAYKTYKRPLLYFAAFSKHLGFYATPSGHEAFEKELSKYKQGKGSVQFPLNQPIPYNLMEEIIRFRAKENTNKWSKK